MENFDSYLAAVDELVDDENKLVTYKLVSHQLALPISRAKQVLENYAKHNTGVSVVHTLTGKTSKGLRVSLVREVDLDEAKARLDHVVSSHPYSVQKTKLKDPNPLYSADYEMTKTTLFKCGSCSAIKYSGSKSLTEEEIQQMKDSMKKVTVEDTMVTTKNTSPKNATKKPASQKGITSLFGTKPQKKTSQTDTGLDQNETNKKKEVSTNQEKIQKKTEKQENGPAKQSTKKPSGMNAFVKKGKIDPFAMKAKTSPKAKNSPPKVKSPQQKSSAPSISEEEDNMEIDEVDSPPPIKNEVKTDDLLDEIENQSKKPNPQKKTTPKARNKPKAKKPRTNSGELPAKKRRRIQELSSSSEEASDDDFNDDVIPPSPEPLMAKSGNVIKVGGKNAHKKRVLKSHTYQDKDGSMLTEKKWEEISCSSEEEEPVTNSNKNNGGAPEQTIKTPSPEVKTALKKNKQASIMGFFSKKSSA
uniref:DNA polymerase delta subunit 3 n=1 Tax=Phallusia mammillata TaxID=59560 RepID=A0A6F9DNH5_9ASCI|nr:DNA polymerase delta subunit 3 [Phallusia mammillata]